MKEVYKTTYYIEVWHDGKLHKSDEFMDEEAGIKAVQERWPSGRLIRKIVTTKVNENIVYPVGIGE